MHFKKPYFPNTFEMHNKNPRMFLLHWNQE